MRFWLALVLCVVSAGARAGETLDLTPFVQQDVYEWVKISPDGKYFAVTKPLEDRTALLILRREDHAFTAKIMGGPDSVVDDFWWANGERVVVSLSRKQGSRDELVSAVPVTSDPVVRIEKLDIYSRNRVRIAEVPVQRANFVSEPHRREYYARLLSFLGQHLGGATAAK